MEGFNDANIMKREVLKAKNADKISDARNDLYALMTMKSIDIKEIRKELSENKIFPLEEVVNMKKEDLELVLDEEKTGHLKEYNDQVHILNKKDLSKEEFNKAVEDLHSCMEKIYEIFHK